MTTRPGHVGVGIAIAPTLHPLARAGKQAFSDSAFSIAPP